MQLRADAIDESCGRVKISLFRLCSVPADAVLLQGWRGSLVRGLGHRRDEIDQEATSGKQIFLIE
jgi:hypothetical protein